MIKKFKHGLVNDTVTNNDIDELIDWLKTYPRLTKGPLTVELEQKWSKWLGVKHSIYVNSGSSANLIMIYSLLITGELQPGDAVIVPAISWATDLSPIIQFGLTPILCDCNLSDLSIDINHFEKICKEQSPKALMLVSVLGLVPEMDRILEICKKYNIVLLEDTCESLGSTFEHKKLGTFGIMSSFSLYFGHHISTIEGGFVCTNDDELANILLSIRNHGWDRDWSDDKQKSVRKLHNISEFDAQYTFYYPGFNVRSTDLQAFIGLNQLKKLDTITKIRERNFETYINELKNLGLLLPENRKNGIISNFCFPVIHNEREKIINALQSAGIETRPLICGSMGTQPMYVEKYGRLELPNANIVDKFGLYVPNNQQMNELDVKYIAKVIKGALS
jgi:CDP-6-deoxy-D-xylo-4-hexulose-3-dehydrase